MQRLGGNFLVKQVVMYHLENGNIVELYELPNGQWQFGKGHDAVVVTSLEQVVQLDEHTKKQIAAWLKRIEHQPTPEPIQAGMTPMLSGATARDQLSQALAVMPEEAITRLLGVVQQVMAPIADSLKQAAQTNSHSDGFGQDEEHYPPGSTTAQPFQLPAGAKWCDPTRPASGYLTFPEGVTDGQGKPVSVWHPTPEFHDTTMRPDPIPVAETAVKPATAREPVGASSERAAKRRR